MGNKRILAKIGVFCSFANKWLSMIERFFGGFMMRYFLSGMLLLFAGLVDCASTRVEIVSHKAMCVLILRTVAGDDVGRATFQITVDQYSETRKACLDLLEIKPDFQNRGLGGYLFSHVVTFLADRGVSMVDWVASPIGSERDHTVARAKIARLVAFYEAQGGIAMHQSAGGRKFVFPTGEMEAVAPHRAVVEAGRDDVVAVQDTTNSRGYSEVKIFDLEGGDEAVICSCTLRHHAPDERITGDWVISAIEDLEYFADGACCGNVHKALEGHCGVVVTDFIADKK